MSKTIISTLVTPATAMFSGGGIYDLIDLATVKGLLGITDGSQDTYLRLLIAQVSGGIRTHCNRTFQVETIQDQIWPQRDAASRMIPGGEMPLQLSRYPIAGSPSQAGTPAPSLPALAKSAGGTLAAATYFVRVTYVTPTGETPVSPEATLVVAADNLLQVASPAIDAKAVATGWNVYVASASGQETLQNATPIEIGTGWTEPTGGLVTNLAAMPSFVGVVENPNTPQGLIEGVDFLSDFSEGQLSRLDATGYPRLWGAIPFAVLYQAGFKALPPDVQDACIRLVRGAFYALKRDPMLRSENIEGVYEAQYWFGNGPGGAVGYPPDVQDLLDRHRVPVIA